MASRPSNDASRELISKAPIAPKLVSEISSLNEIGRKFGTDKSSFGKQGGAEGAGHDYLRFYEQFLESRRRNVRKVLEIGVQKGASLRMWQEYFPDARIYGLDIAESALKITGERIDVRLLDQSDAEALRRFAVSEGPFDVIVEDGSHRWEHQIISLQVLLDFVRPGGVYIVEDLHTSYSPAFGTPGGVTGVEYVLKCCEKVIAENRLKAAGPDANFMMLVGEKIDYVTLYRRAAAFFLRS